MELIINLIGIVTGVISLAGVIYLIGYWKGTVDTRMRQLEKYPPEETALMAKTLWDIYVVGALHNRPDLAEHASAFKLKKEAEDLIPGEIKQALGEINRNPLNRNDVASGWLVVKSLGLPAIEKMAAEKNLSVQEAIAILSTYLINTEES